MFLFHGNIHVLATIQLAIYYVSGEQKVPTPKKPKVVCYGWPNITSVTVSIKTVPVNGIVQYDLFYNRTCDFINECPSDVTSLSLVDGCHWVKNQEQSSNKHSSASKVLDCTICNSTANCYRMGIAKDNDLCFHLRVNTSFGSSHVCMERQVRDKIFYPPPRAIRLLATAKKQLTVLWEHPEGIDLYFSLISYQVLLQDHLGQCTVKKLEGNKNVNSHKFPGLSPWSNYSVKICAGLAWSYIPVHQAACTCGDAYHQPGGPVVSHTLPEEPSDYPLLEPCVALCDDTNFTAILKWKAGDTFIWNGIPTKSLIRIWNSSSPVKDLEEQKLPAPTTTFSVPLEPTYNGSLVTLTLNLTSHVTYIAKVHLCSNGGCGPGLKTTLSCDTCDSLQVSATLFPTTTKSKKPESPWLAVGAGATISVLVIAVVITIYVNKKKRQRNHQSLREAIGDLPHPAVYEEPDSADMTSDYEPYNEVYSSETQLLLQDEQRAQWV